MPPADQPTRKLSAGEPRLSADDTVPWQRVINAQGACSTGRVVLPPDLQQRLLEAEGVRFDARGRCDLARYRWTPEEYADGEGDAEQPSLFGG